MERDKDYGRPSHERGRGYTQERDIEYGLNQPIQDLERHGARERELEPGEHDYGREWYGERAKHGHGHGRGYDYSENCDNVQPRGFGEPEHEQERLRRQGHEYYGDQYENMEGVNNKGQFGEGDPDEHEEGEAGGEYQRSERSPSR
ncbi:U1 small nuclear ribonucleoprotein 70 kDa [Iris pallida]|uniref:U1 small nuclear ribonucleoprotein 70 kDa n=1 Tax=Iris pallida TaxID=29817 RepID=A0AAX6FG49_IRIPA|nr:U1 small nuclear ribonucleoprotein 70 kDa [Iris pallida]